MLTSFTMSDFRLYTNTTWAPRWNLDSWANDHYRNRLFPSMRIGISPGDFIKPEPGLTLSEKRHYILDELKQWLCGIKMSSAVEAMIAEDVNIEGDMNDINAGLYPLGRMYKILRTLDPTLSGMWGARDVGKFCYSICEEYLMSGVTDTPADLYRLTLGFIDVDLLPGGETIRSHWSRSPFVHLREAAPLSDIDDSIYEINHAADEIEVEKVEAEEVEAEVEEVEAEAEKVEAEVEEVEAEAEKVEAEAEVEEEEAEAEVEAEEVEAEEVEVEEAEAEEAEVEAEEEEESVKDVTLLDALIMPVSIPSYVVVAITAILTSYMLGVTVLVSTMCQ